ncbi:hypothetical protein GCM10020008_16620 [Lentilactobacillus kefiri DSM 20587 = JCM 5818]|uniref:Uncharacterized protein n=1 Tax=Lentilactobacillus kefiri TaxID=33962 RepID=A0A511DUF7_LENKE|nr:hypothetical protein LKE01_12820 [Lentilactobacillus kefiri]
MNPPKKINTIPIKIRGNNLFFDFLAYFSLRDIGNANPLYNFLHPYFTNFSPFNLAKAFNLQRLN